MDKIKKIKKIEKIIEKLKRVIAWFIALFYLVINVVIAYKFIKYNIVFGLIYIFISLIVKFKILSNIKNMLDNYKKYGEDK